MLLAKHLNVEFKVSMRKQTIQNLLIDKLIELDIFGEDALHLKVESANMLDLKRMEMEHEFKMKDMELRKLEIEKKKRNEKGSENWKFIEILNLKKNEAWYCTYTKQH